MSNFVDEVAKSKQSTVSTKTKKVCLKADKWFFFSNCVLFTWFTLLPTCYFLATETHIFCSLQFKEIQFQKLQRLLDGCHPDFDNDHLCSVNNHDLLPEMSTPSADLHLLPETGKTIWNYNLKVVFLFCRSRYYIFLINSFWRSGKHEDT